MARSLRQRAAALQETAFLQALPGGATAGAWGAVCGERLTFDAPPNPARDRLEGGDFLTSPGESLPGSRRSRIAVSWVKR